MKSRILNLLVILTSLLGYLEWGTRNSMFLYQAEWEIISKLVTDTASALHPFTLLPLLGQMVLLFTLFQKRPGKVLTFIGMTGIGMLLVFMSFIGIISLNFKILLSTLPFLAIGFLTIRHHRTW